jgi:hypothetical protein
MGASGQACNAALQAGAPTPTFPSIRSGGGIPTPAYSKLANGEFRPKSDMRENSYLSRTLGTA